jgi:ketosteroid isomerase-like protein
VRNLCLARAFLILATFAVPSSAAVAAGPTREFIVQLEQQLTDALSRVDVPTIERLWADDFVFIAPNGRMFTKPERVARLAPADKVESGGGGGATAENNKVTARVFGRTAVAVIYSNWHGGADGGDFSERYVATHVWTERGGRWQLVLAHVTQVKEDAP